MRALALAGLVLLAGCLGGTDGRPDDEAPVPPDTPGPPWFHRPSGAPATLADYGAAAPVFEVRLVPGVTGWEPTVAVTSAGTMFLATESDATGQLGDASGVGLHRSRDAGMTWEDLTPRLATVAVPHSASDPYVTVDAATDRVYGDELRAECTTLSWSDDDGETWTTNPAACGNPFEDHQTLFTGPTRLATTDPAFPRALYLCSSQVAATSCKRSLDGGLTFQPLPPPLAADRLDCAGGTSGHGVASEASGTAFIGQAGCGVAHVARLGLDDAAWTVASFAQHGTCGHDVHVAVDAVGTVYAGFLDGDCLPRVAVSRDDGGSWTDPMTVGLPGLAQASHMALAAHGDGGLVVSYLGTHEGEDLVWTLYAGLTRHATTDDPVFATVAASGRPIVAGDNPGWAGAGQGLHGVGDFLDAAVIPATGAAVLSLTDVCQGPCSAPGEEGAPLGTLGVAIQVDGWPLPP